MRFLLILLLLIFSAPSFSFEYFPAYNNPNYFYGKGIVSIKGKAYVYKTDDENSQKVSLINTDTSVFKSRTQNKIRIEDIFIAFSDEDNLALVPVNDDNDNWFNVCYSQSKKLFGWVKKSENTDFMSWEDFLNLYGRKHGVYIFNNVAEKHKKLYSQPSENSMVVDSFFVARHISLWLISGDWILVKLTTYDGLLKTGWLRWRLADGSIILFPEFEK